MERTRRLLAQGLLYIPRLGAVVTSGEPALPSLVVDADGAEVVPVSMFLRDLMLCDMRPATCRSYAHDLLRWFRLLWLVEMGWERATTSEVALMVGWLRSAPNPQRRRGSSSATVAGDVNPRTGKPELAGGIRPPRSTMR